MTNPDIKNAGILIVDDMPANVELLEKTLKLEWMKSKRERENILPLTWFRRF